MATQAVVASFRRRRNTIQQQYRQAYLGDERNLIDVPGQPGRVYIRYSGGVDENGYARFQPATAVRCAIGAAYLPNVGATVVVGNDADGFDCVITGAWAQTIQAGITPAISNPLRREARFFTVDSFIPFQSYPVATGNTPSTLVTVREWIYEDDNGDIHRYQGTQLEADKVDLAPYIPAAGLQRYAVVWHDTWLEAQGFTSEVVTVSTPKAMTIPMNDTDLEECFDLRPADAEATEAYYLADGQTVVRQSDKHLDLRQILKNPRLLGNPNPITKNMRVWQGRQLLYHGWLEVTGSLEVLGEVVVLPSGLPASDSGGSGEAILGNPNPIIGSVVLEAGRELFYSGQAVVVTGQFIVYGAGRGA